ncbi:MAG: VCBS repeat-containing protein [Chitinophagaceae bacterium]
MHMMASTFLFIDYIIRCTAFMEMNIAQTKKRWSFSALMILCASLFLLAACHQKQNTLFTALTPEQSGITFSNNINENDSSNSFINEFGYMGGGVGIGDFNNDGLKDIFFTGNQVSCRLYINKGDNHFEDITEKAGISTHEWATGVSIVDINNDGYDDIYVCVFGKDLLHRSKNLLFINDHNLHFHEAASEYGLADTGYSTQAVFFDYDRDGDLDMYLANYLLNNRNANDLFPKDKSGHSPANDKLYRNDGDKNGIGHPVYTDVSLEAGIKEDGYGLGLAVSDFNNDGWPDVYVANDFVSNDELWINNRNGTFSNKIDEAICHQSYSAMGADAADINNDALPDIVTLDMAPEYNERKKTSVFFMNYDRYQAERNLGYQPEFARNMLQLNTGVGDSVPLFSEIGQLAGISETDWSWSVLLADFDNDGWKDMHVTNGIGRDFINGDFLEFSNNMFSSTGSVDEKRKSIREKLSSLKPVKLNNYLFLNNKDNTFKDISDTAGIGGLSLSNGAAYADIDNDGDLDLVVNNINQPAFVLINNTRNKGSVSNHFLKLKLRGDSLNTKAYGAKVTLYTGGTIQMQEQNPVRGYFSSVDPDLVFGLGNNTIIDSCLVIWPDQKKQLIKNIKADTVLELSWKQATTIDVSTQKQTATLFQDYTAVLGLSYLHHDNNVNDFAVQRLLPQKYSQMGPFICTGDVNADGLTDFFIGDGFNHSGMIMIQQANGSFSSHSLQDSIKMQDDMGAVFFDADADGDLDLLVTSGDVQYEENSPWYKPRLYKNNGHGNFKIDSAAIPANVTTIAGYVAIADYDNDGDMDVFVGGRVSKNYPAIPKSFLLQNNHGVFKDVTAAVCPALQNPGMVGAAVWTDFDGDKQTDLIIAGEWMPLRFFKNNNGQLLEMTNSTGLSAMDGMWRSLGAADLDNDGDMDIVAGNLGMNCIYKASPSTPMELYAADIDGNGSIDPVLFYNIKAQDGSRKLSPAISRSLLAEQVPGMKKRFLHYSDYAKASQKDIFKGVAKDKMQHFVCNETRSCWFENIGAGKFIKHSLPLQAQYAPVNTIIAEDIDGDGYKDLLLAGNEYQADVITGRYDASYGLFLKGSKDKTFVPIASKQSGLLLRGDIKSMVTIPVGNSKEKILVAAANNDSLQAFRIKP